MLEIEDITLKFNNIVERLSIEGTASFYHLKSIHNFLVHLEELKNETNKNEALKLINEYLDYISLYDLNSKEDSKNAYLNLVHPIGEIYSKHARFIYLVGFDLIFITLLSGNLLLFTFYKNWIAFAILNTVGVVYFLFILYKLKEKRAYGPIF